MKQFTIAKATKRRWLTRALRLWLLLGVPLSMLLSFNSYNEHQAAIQAEGYASGWKAIVIKQRRDPSNFIGPYEIRAETPLYREPRDDSPLLPKDYFTDYCVDLRAVFDELRNGGALRDKSCSAPTLKAGTTINVVAVRGKWLEIHSKDSGPYSFVKKDAAVPLTSMCAGYDLVSKIIGEMVGQTPDSKLTDYCYNSPDHHVIEWEKRKSASIAIRNEGLFYSAIMLTLPFTLGIVGYAVWLTASIVFKVIRWIWAGSIQTSGNTWKHLAVLALGIPVVYLATYFSLGSLRQDTEGKVVSSPPQTSNQEIRVVVASQDSEGVTQQNFNMNFLKNLETHTVERVKLKAKEFLVSQGHPNAQLDISSEAVYVESGPMKLAVIRLRGSDGSNHVDITGIVGNQLRSVGCLRNSTETIPISYGVCAEKIKEVFGVKIGS